MKKCEYCSEKVDHELTETSEGLVCDDCLENEFFECGECGEYHRLSDESSELDGICEDCFDSYYFVCVYCGDVEKIDESRANDNGENVCEHCFNEHYCTCAGCDEVMSRDSDSCYLSDNDREHYCHHCYHDRYETCCNCGCEIDRDYAYHDDDGDPYCEGCYDDRRGSDSILNYTYKPNWDFYKKSNEQNPVFFGVEIEVEPRDGNERFKIAEEITNDVPCICKEDGSLGADAFEIVTMPMSYKYITERDIFGKISKYNNRLKSYYGYQCGVHIHISKSAFKTELHLAKFMLFFAKNRSFIEIIAQRKNNSYWTHEEQKDCVKKAKGHSSGRYVAVNIENSSTVEVRIFRGNLKKSRNMKNLQFMIALVEFCEKPSLKKLTSDNFIKYTETTEYEDLKQFINLKNK